VVSRARARGGKTTIPIAIVGGIMGMPAINGAYQAALQGDLVNVLNWVKGIAGIDNSNNFNSELLKKNAIPLLIGFAVHKGAGMLGVNRALGAAKIPLLRV